MSQKMLIDATHPEETRVAVMERGRLEEFDVDTSTKKQIKGNIYLAKVVRVEPSLQACFVDYGGNRHGFLAFGEIHPDYYQIPVADREALKDSMNSDKDDDDSPSRPVRDDVEVVSESETEDVARVRPNFFRKYKIQEVIRAGQVMLIQVVKEERGNKGAALTTYLSLAGRYSVLMPNNGKGGGVSRKINSAADRKALRDIVDKLPIPKGMSVIVRTAGQCKTKPEIKRDYDYLIKTWMKIRSETLESIAPKLIHEEGNIIKRSLRDTFTPDIDEIIVDGDESVFKVIRDFVKLLMPNQIKKVKQYKGKTTLFQEEHVEPQLEALHTNVVQLRSGGYLVIDQTEALVAVDVNSGRATREHDIEETALRINSETCDELARQLRLRDLAGLIVIDFIDMDEQKNNAAVERRLKEALKQDRARIQVGRISGFGLLELSRQRLHSSFLESSYKPCACCGGKGWVRSVESCAMNVLHVLEEAGIQFPDTSLVISVQSGVANYVLNHKKEYLLALEKKYKVSIQVVANNTLLKPSDYCLERVRENGDKSQIQLAQFQLPKRDNRPAKPERANDKNADKQGARDNAAPADPADDKSRSRNQRRREWKRRRQEEYRARDGGQQNAPSAAPPAFKVVEQADIKEITPTTPQNTPPAPAPQQAPAPTVEQKPTPAPEPAAPTPPAPRKKGWWNKLVE